MSNRDIDIANRYHTVTKRLYLPLEHKPLAYKPYRNLDPIFLPTDMVSLEVSTLEAVGDCVSSEGTGQTLDLASLATLLFYTAGRIRQRDFADAGTVTFRAASSAGGLYPIEVYVVCGDLSGLAAGVYHFSPMDFALRRLREGDYRHVLSQAAGDDAAVATGPVTLVFSAIFWRSAWKLEAGVIGGRMYLCAYALGLGASGLTFFDDEVTAFFSPTAADLRAIFVVALGKTASENSVRPFRSRLGMKIDALSRRDTPTL